jgi:hypothetical protein
MWEVRKEALPAQRVVRGEVWELDRRITVAEIIARWTVDEEFRETFSRSLAETEFEEFFFETPPVTKTTDGQPFEFVQVEGTMLPGLTPEPQPFANQFANSDDAVLTFPNLGGDAVLVVPAPQSDPANYSHLAAFLRGAPPTQIDEFWRRTGIAMGEQLSDKPLWLSTAGLGVSWLHLRLDSWPKYYRYRPYKEMRT